MFLTLIVSLVLRMSSKIDTDVVYMYTAGYEQMRVGSFVIFVCT